MKREYGDEQVHVMSGTKDWYDKAGRNPLAEPGFTPQLMARIEQAAEKRSSGKSGQRQRFGRIAGLGGLAAVLLFGVLLWPFGQWGTAIRWGSWRRSSTKVLVQRQFSLRHLLQPLLPHRRNLTIRRLALWNLSLAG